MPGSAASCKARVPEAGIGGVGRMGRIENEVLEEAPSVSLADEATLLDAGYGHSAKQHHFAWHRPVRH